MEDRKEKRCKTVIGLKVEVPVLTGTVIMPLLIQLYKRDKEFTYTLRNLQCSEIFGEHLETIYSQMTVPQIYSICTVRQEFQGSYIEEVVLESKANCNNFLAKQ